MSRKKISEYRAKVLILKALEQSYEGRSIDLQSYDGVALRSWLQDAKTYVVKIDQAVKKRNTLGLVRLNLTPNAVLEELAQLKGEGYKWALVEDFYLHDQSSEAFFALMRDEEGVRVSFSRHGGVNVESYSDKIQTGLVTDRKMDAITVEESLKKVFTSWLMLFEAAHMTYIEINPFVIDQGRVSAVLDAAVEVDTAAEFFVGNAWSAADFRYPKKQLHEIEGAIEKLAATSPASLSLKVLNENGSLFLLLSGGGASVTVVDEITHLGYHKEIANYGEYSGNPTEEETYLYTKQVLKLLSRSSSDRKVLLIAGGVANFTDIANTFKGVIKAIDEEKNMLLTQHVKVFVRRGGPNQKAGLSEMKAFLDKVGIENSVSGPEISLATIVRRAVEGMRQ